MYLILNNICKKLNIGMMMRSACAFGVKCVILIGGTKFHVGGAKGTQKHVPTLWFAKLRECVAFVKERGGRRRHALCGIGVNAGVLLAARFVGLVGGRNSGSTPRGS